MVSAHVSGWEQHDLHDLPTVMLPGLGLYSIYSDPAQHVITVDTGSMWSFMIYMIYMV